MNLYCTNLVSQEYETLTSLSSDFFSDGCQDGSTSLRQQKGGERVVLPTLFTPRPPLVKCTSG